MAIYFILEYLHHQEECYTTALGVAQPKGFGCGLHVLLPGSREQGSQ